jgi:hypothetical protein
MTPLFQKLNLKDQAEILILNAPESFAPALAALQGVRIVRDLQEAEQVHFSLAFVIKQAELDLISAEVAAKAAGDALIWFAYPKGSSKKYKCEFNRDSGWHVLGSAGFEPVRMVAIDQDWSALRFRRVAYIKSLTRNANMALSDEAKARLQDSGTA